MKLHAIVLSLVVTLGGAGIAMAQTDSPDERAKAVERYFQEVSMRDLMVDMVKEVSKQLPPEQRDAFENTLLRNLRWDTIETAAKQSLAKHLTLTEIDTLTEFMRRPEGKSAMGKMKYYMTDIMPVIQQELVRAINVSRPAPQ